MRGTEIILMDMDERLVNPVNAAAVKDLLPPDFPKWTGSRQTSYVAGRLILSRSLREKLGADDVGFADLDFSARGKPRLGDGFYARHNLKTRLHFNIAHSGNLIAVIFSDSETAVDLEHKKSRRNFAALSAKYYGPDERAIIAEAEGDRQERYFRNFWTGRETLVKYTSEGIWQMAKFSFTRIGTFSKEEKEDLAALAETNALHPAFLDPAAVPVLRIGPAGAPAERTQGKPSGFIGTYDYGDYSFSYYIEKGSGLAVKTCRLEETEGVLVPGEITESDIAGRLVPAVLGVVYD